MNVVGLRAEHHREPLGIGVSRPRLSWQVQTVEQGWMQAGYEISVATEAMSDEVCFGQITSPEQVLVPWPAPPMTSRERRVVRVRVYDIGFFAQPGDDPAKYGLTVWEPAAVYIPKTTTGDKLEAARKFLAFVASQDGCDSMARSFTPSGPFLIKGCTLPSSVPSAIKDMQPYFDSGANSPALEFLSPVKGPALEQICVEVGSGIRPAAAAAPLYDQDVQKQAQQLGLPGW